MPTRFVSDVHALDVDGSYRPVFSPRRDGRAAPVGVPHFLDELITAGLDPAWLEIVDGTWSPAAA